METSIFFAKIIGLFCTTVGVGAFIKRDYFRKILEGYSKNEGTMFVGAMIEFILGFLVVYHHNVWVLGWPVVITLLGWSALIEGLLLTLLPQSMSYSAKNVLKVKTLDYFFALIALAIGLVMLYFGFFA